MVCDFVLILDEVVMLKMVQNEVLRDGLHVMKFHHSADDLPRLERYGVAYLLKRFPNVFSVRSAALDSGGRETLVTFPACNMVWVRLGGGWRRFFFVHRVYGTGVRDCVRLGLEAWRFVDAERLAVEGCDSLAAFVEVLPRSVENGVEVCGLHLFEEEWMPSNCVAVG